MFVKDDDTHNGKTVLEAFVTLFSKTMSIMDELPSISLQDILSHATSRDEANAAFEEKPRPWVSHCSPADTISDSKSPGRGAFHQKRSKNDQKRSKTIKNDQKR